MAAMHPGHLREPAESLIVEPNAILVPASAWQHRVIAALQTACLDLPSEPALPQGALSDDYPVAELPVPAPDSEGSLLLSPAWAALAGMSLYALATQASDRMVPRARHEKLHDGEKLLKAAKRAYRGTSMKFIADLDVSLDDPAA